MDRTVDWLFGWVNRRFGLALPRLVDVADQPALTDFWNRTLIDPPDEDAPLPSAVKVGGTWEILAGFQLNDLTVQFNQ